MIGHLAAGIGDASCRVTCYIFTIARGGVAGLGVRAV